MAQARIAYTIRLACSSALFVPSGGQPTMLLPEILTSCLTAQPFVSPTTKPLT